MLLKRAVTAAMVCAMAVTTGLAAASPAHADFRDLGIEDLRNPADSNHREGWSTDRVLAEFCGDGSRDTRDFYLNVQTGEVRDGSAGGRAPVHNVRDGRRALNPPWEHVRGRCRYDRADLRSQWTGHWWRRVSEPVTNCTGSNQGGRAVRLDYTKTATYAESIEVGVSAGGGFAGAFSAEVTVTVGAEWSDTETRTHSDWFDIDPAAGRTAWWEVQYQTVTVRQNPSFDIEHYSWAWRADDYGNQVWTDTWRGRPDQGEVFSYGFYVDGTTNVLVGEPTRPRILHSRIQDRANTWNDCN
ncbi:hypothetical protein [Nocardiopsis aegyptia]|uniref:Secreted protein n=1 Tax=Nocardiopsis aegyptia TaxID=220378 RepID=A0A7Z0EHJ2_9ACTN|nr:hypothetical protein [Nocardiopsis aegyptia]NYJ32159.1 hypothetical protein [Nocardiopsis aegyptia]